MESKFEQMYNMKQRRKKKFWLIGSISAIIILGTLGIAVASTTIAKVAPDKYVLLSMAKMGKLANENVKESTLLFPEHRKISLALGVDEVKGLINNPKTFLPIQKIKGSELSYAIANSQAGDIMIDLGYKEKGPNSMDISIYSSNNQLGIQIPVLLDQYVMIDLKHLQDIFNQSPLSSYFGTIEQDEANLVNHYVSKGRSAINSQPLQVNPQFNADVQELLIALLTSADIQQTGKAKIMVNNKNKSAKQFSIIMGSGDVKHFIKGVIKSALENTNLLNAVLTSKNKHLQTTLSEAIYIALDQAELSDVEITCDIDRKNRIVNADLSASAGLYGETLNIKSDYALSGAKNIFDTLEANLSLGSTSDHLKCSLAKDKTYGNKKTKTSDTTDFKVLANNYPLFNTTWNLEQDTKATNDNFALTSSMTIANGPNISFNLLGDLLVNKKDQEYSLVAKKIAIKGDAYLDVFNIVGSGYFKVENLKDQSITISAEEQMDFSNIGIKQIIDITTRIGARALDIRKILNYFPIQ